MIKIAFIRCYEDCIWNVIIQAAAKLGSQYRIDNERLNVIKTCCNLLDDMDKTCNIVGYSGHVDVENSLDLAVTMMCNILEMHSIADDFYTILNNSKEFTIDPVQDKYIDVTFVFSGIFIRPKCNTTQTNGLIFDLATIAINQTSDKRDWKDYESPKKWIELSICCNALDSFMRCVGGQIEQVMINEDEKQIAIRILSPSYTDEDILSETTWWPYQWMIKKMKYFVKEDLDADNVLTVAVFDGIWNM